MAEAAVVHGWHDREVCFLNFGFLALNGLPDLLFVHPAGETIQGHAFGGLVVEAAQLDDTANGLVI